MWWLMACFSVLQKPDSAGTIDSAPVGTDSASPDSDPNTGDADSGGADSAGTHSGTGDSGAGDSGAGDSGGGDSGAGDSGGGDSGAEAWTGYTALTLNLHCLKQDGTRFGSLDERLDYIAAAAHTEDVALILAQEACRQGSTDALELLRQRLETYTGQSWSSTWVLAHIGWEGTADEAEEGVGILVRGPDPLSEPWSWTYGSQGAFQRVMAGATLPPSMGGLRVHSVHLEVFDDDLDSRRRQAADSASVALSAAGHADVLVAGDFNDIDSSDTVAAMTDRGYRDAVAGLESDQIDHIFLHRGAAVSVSDPAPIFDGVRYDVVSDHHGYTVKLSPGVGEGLRLTTVETAYDPGFGHLLTVRGDTAPLSWDYGDAAWSLPGGGWRLVMSELTSTLTYKWLLDDLTWQDGADEVVSSGGSVVDTPTFP